LLLCVHVCFGSLCVDIYSLCDVFELIGSGAVVQHSVYICHGSHCVVIAVNSELVRLQKLMCRDILYLVISAELTCLCCCLCVVDPYIIAEGIEPERSL